MKPEAGFRVGARRDLSQLEPADLARRLLAALWRNLFVLAAALLVGLGVGGYVAWSQAPVFKARASIIIDPRVEENLTGAQVPTALMADALYVDSEVEVLRSEQVLGGVVDRLDLVDEARAQRIEDAKTAGAPVDPASIEPGLLRQVAIEDLTRRVSVGREGNTYVVRITAEAKEPDRAAAIANAVAETYFDQRARESAGKAEDARVFLREQADTMAATVQEAEARADRFLLENNLSDDAALSSVDQEVRLNEAAVAEARGQIRRIRGEVATIDRALSSEGEAARAAQAQLAAALGGATDIRLSGAADALAQLRDIRGASLSLLEAEVDSLLAAGVELRAELARLVDAQVELRGLRRTAAAAQAQYEAILARLEAAESETGFFQVNARVIEAATPPQKPDNPSLPVLILAGAAAGLLGGLGLAFAREQLDDSLRTSDDVAAVVGLPYFGPVPMFNQAERAAARDSSLLSAPGLQAHHRQDLADLVYAAAEPHSFAAETFRRIMIDLRASFPKKRPVVIAVASAVANEGKTVLAANLAFFLARHGRKILLVDADLRNPDLSRRLAPMADGRCPMLRSAPLEPGSALFFACLNEGVTLLGADDPHQLMDAERDLAQLEGILRDAADAIDVVVIDLPPLAFVSDSIGLEGVIDSVVLAVRWGRTRAGALRRVLAANSAIAEKLTGVVLTRVRRSVLRRDEYLPTDDRYYRLTAETVARPKRPRSRRRA